MKHWQQVFVQKLRYLFISCIICACFHSFWLKFHDNIVVVVYCVLFIEFLAFTINIGPTSYATNYLCCLLSLSHIFLIFRHFLYMRVCILFSFSSRFVEGWFHFFGMSFPILEWHVQLVWILEAASTYLDKKKGECISRRCFKWWVYLRNIWSWSGP